jgi:hypothetical protein
MVRVGRHDKDVDMDMYPSFLAKVRVWVLVDQYNNNFCIYLEK